MATQSRGRCAYCGYETTKGAMARHLAKCPQRQEQIAAAAESGRRAETLYYLRAQSAEYKEFWLDLEVRGPAKLKDIDSYLRAIWLECCGHLSEFTIGRYGKEIPMTKRVEAAFNTNVELNHIYDFGTSSETLIQFVDKRTGPPTTKHPIALLARNLLPAMECLVCGQPATHLCQECLIEEDTSGMLCAAHAQDHPHDSYGEPIELVNSPRLGMCGYEGPADAPY